MTRRAALATLVAASLLAACTAVEAPLGGGGGGGDGAEEQDGPALQAVTTTPGETATVLDAADPASAALEVVQALWRQAPLVVVAPAGDETAGTAAARAAEDLAAPVLLTAAVSGGGEAAPDPALAAELDRLGASRVLTVGEVGDLSAALADPLPDLEVVAEAEGGRDGLPDITPAAAQPGTAVLVPTGAALAAARTSALTAGARVVDVEDPDPRAASETVTALAAEPVEHVLGVGAEFGPVDRLAWRTEVAATGVELPGGGQRLFPDRRLVALYGHPGTSALGILGEQDADEAVALANETAADYQPYSDEPVVPAFEIITTIASSSAGADGDYSNEAPIDRLRPFVDAAAEEGVYVVLDLQPGRTDFLTQAQLYEELLVQPHVGLALDPEWRLRPGEVHLRQIGSVSAEEVNEVGDWLAGIVRERRLPQKLFLLHQFRTSMLRDREAIRADRDELATLVQMDGNGAPDTKFATWDALLQDPPEGLLFGWKNFIDEDSPTFTPEETFAVEPKPWWVSYQ